MLSGWRDGRRRCAPGPDCSAPALRYPDRTQVVRDAGFEGRIGEVVALVGATDARKSTLACLLAGSSSRKTGRCVSTASIRARCVDCLRARSRSCSTRRSRSTTPRYPDGTQALRDASLEGRICGGGRRARAREALEGVPRHRARLPGPARSALRAGTSSTSGARPGPFPPNA